MAGARAGSSAIVPGEEMDDDENFDENDPEEEQKSDAPKRRSSNKIRKRKTTLMNGLRDVEESKPPDRGGRARVRICCEDPLSSKGAMVFHTLFGVAILASMAVVTFESLNHNGRVHPTNMDPHVYRLLELIFTILFTLDLVTRGLVADRYFVKRRYPDTMESHPPFFRDLLNFFDLLSVMPLPIDLISGTLLGKRPRPPWIRLFSIFRVLRIFKVTRHFDGTKIIVKTAQTSAAPIVVSCFMLVSFMMVVSPIMFLVEPCLDEENCVFTDGFNTAYYLMITLTTVGYGDQAPLTMGGRVVAIAMMLSGALYMAMPLAIIGSKFTEAYSEHEEEKAKRDPAWAEDQMRRLQNVTRRRRRVRSLHLGYQVAEELGELSDLEENESAALSAAKATGSINRAMTTKQLLLGALFEDSGQLAIDINVLFGLNYHETKEEELRQRLKKEKTKDGVNLGGAFWATPDPFVKNDGLTPDQLRKIELLKQGKAEITTMHAMNEEYLKRVEKALDRGTCKDKTWLCTDVPKSSKCAAYYHWFSLMMTFLSIILFLAETMPEYNEYRNGGRNCKQVVKYHCENVYKRYGPGGKDEDLSFLWANRGCFSTEQQVELFNNTYDLPSRTGYYDENGNFTEDTYGGCWEPEPGFSDAKIKERCDWPRPELGYMCKDGIESILDAKFDPSVIRKLDNQKIVLRHETSIEEETWKYDDENEVWVIDNPGKWKSVNALNIIRQFGEVPTHRVPRNSMEREADYLKAKAILAGVSQSLAGVSGGTKNFVDPFDVDWANDDIIGDRRLNVCSREQCVDNGSEDWSRLFLIAEWIFAAWFVIEIFLRIFSARELKVYFTTISNVFDIGAVCISIGEVVMIPTLIGESGYEVWGSGADPGVMRFLRILVTIRFITMQRHFSGLKVISMTVKKVAGKMKIPIFFFFIFAVVFASIFYVIESGNLMIDCKEGDPFPKRPIDVLSESRETIDDWIFNTTGLEAPNPKTNALKWQSLGMDWYNTRHGECRYCPEDVWVNPLDHGLNYSTISKYNSSCKAWVRASGQGGDILAEPKVIDMVDAVWCMIVTMTTVGYGVYYPTQAAGKATSLVAALFGSFYMAMPLTIVGTDFYDIYKDVQREDDVMKEKVDKLFQKTKKKTKIVVDGQLSLSQVSKLKLRGLAARDRVREMGLHPDEIKDAFGYIDAVEALAENHGPSALRDFEGRHFEMMKLMSKHLIHRKTGLSQADITKAMKDLEKKSLKA